MYNISHEVEFFGVWIRFAHRFGADIRHVARTHVEFLDVIETIKGGVSEIQEIPNSGINPH
jgi:hypothetical protein